MKKVNELSLTSLLAVILVVSGAFKIPSPFPGTEFQLSAPLAVAIAAVFGFTRYICAGIVASILGLLLGTQTIIGVLIAMTFRIVAGGVIALFGPRFWVVSIAGPLGSAAARLVVWFLIGKGLIPLLLASLPGMIFTALAAWPLTKKLKRASQQYLGEIFSYERKII
ncbi:MAG: hypothetical protein PWP31_147 [Clostridia bacterium]|nr:hypothetical protein [Clostridia bacterium]